ncbi:MAG: hypothetical protein KY469_13750 [Actinobacteria bacterium]|nr:hypothetical protein [Actinomycetota bacterium]
MSRVRVLALLMLASMVTVACGARLTDEQRQFVIEQGALGATTGGDTTGADAPTTGATEVPATTTGGTTTATTGTTGSTATTGTATGGTTGGTTGATTQETATSGGETTGGTATGDASTTGSAGEGTTGGAAACGASVGADVPQVAITDDVIKVANASDIGGAVPGLFKDAQLATLAYFAMINGTEGGVCGRQLDLARYDTRLDSNGNRQAYTDACSKTFAAVGSMSAFEQGAAPVVRDCNYPDLRTAAPNKTMQQVPTAFSTDAMSPGWQPLAEYNYWATQADVKRAGFYYIRAETTEYQVNELVVPGTEAGAGYDFVEIQGIDISETNYGSHVLTMKNPSDGGPPLDFVAFQGAWQQGLRLADAMQQQNYAPSIYALQSNAYTPDILTQDRRGSLAATNTQIAVPSVILEEADRHPELLLYAQWVNQVEPGARPTGLGIYAWSAARLFVETLKTMPELSRTALIDKLGQVNGFEGNGLIPPQNIGEKIPADCVIIIAPRDGAFHRVEPAGQGMRCDNHVQQVPVE